MADQTDRNTLSDAILGRICNVSNLPKWMQVAALGQSMRPLANAIVDAILASTWLADHDRQVAAEAVEKVAREWQCGGWTILTAPPPAGSIPALALGQRVTNWLRGRADQTEGGDQ